MTLDGLKTAFHDTALGLTGVSTFAFDDLSVVNIDRNKSYKLFLMKPSSFRLESERSDYRLYSINCFILDLEVSKTPDQIATLWSDICELFETFKINLCDNYTDIISIVDQDEYILGQHQHNDKLIGVQAQFTLKVFNCNTSTTT